MLDPIITKEALIFLSQLEKNNNREWFGENKKEFKTHEARVKVFYEAVGKRLRLHDEIEKVKMFRIYRDVRFSKNKAPYKAHFAGSFPRLGAQRRGGYYLHIKPGESFVATGFWGPSKEDLLRIRKEFEQDASEMREIMAEPGFKKIWGELGGDEVKTAPKGFDKTHTDIDLIKKKQYVFVRKFTDEQVLSPNFAHEIDEAYRAIRPFFDYMSDVLTTNLNGESLLD
ncbi:DUF2461 domain-containing protein [Zobellia uliginosa]|uniref:DUF2461 domain-containing protein n=1 Tax=Zobellia uliginosa TaxID=143224 RepID=UPI0026E3163A|nr:DUF2461 domain-containing protein [Zobellia uliginosa]MDO6517912.1 DUF2461 domain-containing protein [Zobellia uliginosa]